MNGSFPIIFVVAKQVGYIDYLRHCKRSSVCFPQRILPQVCVTSLSVKLVPSGKVLFGWAKTSFVTCAGLFSEGGGS